MRSGTLSPGISILNPHAVGIIHPVSLHACTGWDRGAVARRAPGRSEQNQSGDELRRPKSWPCTDHGEDDRNEKPRKIGPKEVHWCSGKSQERTV